MKLLALLLSLLPFPAFADPTLTLTWIQPPGYQSTLYSATNLSGSWTTFGVVNPPVPVQATNQISFFYVAVIPTNCPNAAVIYTNDPNVENLKPTNTNSPAVAYTDDGSGALYVWSLTDQMWK